MSDTPSPADYRDIVRYCYAIAVISAVSITVLVGSIFSRYHVEAQTRNRLENFHVRNIMLTSEVSAKVEWLARFSDEHGSTTADEWTRGSDIASQGRRASVALSSIAQALDSITLLQENHGSAEFAGMVDRAVSLTRQLLAFSHYEIVERDLVDLNLAFQDMQPLLRRLIREDISLELDLGEGVGMARVDHVQIEQILMNLVTNACHAMPDGGKLTIGTAVVELDPAEAAIRGMAPGKYSYIRVEDSGCGMSPEVRSRAFEPFFTTKKIGEGTGLGLSTIYGIVTGIDGHVNVDSEVGRGTRFDIYLPHEDRRDEDDGEDPEHIEALMGTETLLLVEDDEQVRKLTVTANSRPLSHENLGAFLAPCVLASQTFLPSPGAMVTKRVDPSV